MGLRGQGLRFKLGVSRLGVSEFKDAMCQQDIGVFSNLTSVRALRTAFGDLSGFHFTVWVMAFMIPGFRFNLESEAV